MKNKLDEGVSQSVLFCKKVLDNDTVLICRVDMTPMHTENRCGYQFILKMTCASESDSVEIPDVTSDYLEAERIFNLICANDVYPCHLRDIIEDCLAGA